jgi:hypothetical protein
MDVAFWCNDLNFDVDNECIMEKKSLNGFIRSKTQFFVFFIFSLAFNLLNGSYKLVWIIFCGKIDYLHNIFLFKCHKYMVKPLM